MATYPQGIDEGHGTARGNRHASWWRLGILLAILAVALSGVLGGANGADEAHRQRRAPSWR